MSVTVPSVERGPPPRRRWSTITAVERFSIRSASGWPSLGRKPRTNAENVSLSWRCASAAMVSNTSDDLPEPLTPTNAVIARLGTATDTSRRLFSRAPVTVRCSGGVTATSRTLPRDPDNEAAPRISRTPGAFSLWTTDRGDRGP